MPKKSSSTRHLPAPPPFIPIVEALGHSRVEFARNLGRWAVESLIYKCIYEVTLRQRCFLGDSLEPFHPAVKDVRSAVLLRRLGCVSNGFPTIL